MPKKCENKDCVYQREDPCPAADAIKRLEKHKEWGFVEDTMEAIDDGIAALKKRIAKKPNLEGDGYDDEGNLIYDTWICPNCEAHFEVDYDDYNYCPNCGQKLDLSEIN